MPTVLYYREFAPCEVLRPHVTAIFSFVSTPLRSEPPAGRELIREVAFREQDPFSSPLFADGHVSLTLNLERAYVGDGAWRSVAPAWTVIGAMSAVGPARPAARAEMIGAYFRPGRAAGFLGAPSSVLTDQVLALEELWGGAATSLAYELCDSDENARIDRFERALVARLTHAQSRAGFLDTEGLAQHVLARRGRVTVERLADLAGVSRQTLARAFRETIGVAPKLYCMLARFHAGLAFAGAGSQVDWARAAAELGYADQSHMIAEFRRFSSLTPHELASGRWFHPFIERARSRHSAPGGQTAASRVVSG
jgi:AraC-like DNA-binding protein